MRGTYEGPERVYISRRTWMHNNLDNIGTNYTERRRCMNEDQVAQMFIDHGFEEVFCENLTMKEKIGIFSSAKYVSGPIGGGMANALFCPPETKVLSINLTKALGRFAPNLFPAPAPAIIAAVLLIMTVSYCQLRGEYLI